MLKDKKPARISLDLSLTKEKGSIFINNGWKYCEVQDFVYIHEKELIPIQINCNFSSMDICTI